MKECYEKLFPDPIAQGDKEIICENWYDKYCYFSQELLEQYYKDKETFTKKDMFNFFIKGASEAHKHLADNFNKLLKTKTENDLVLILKNIT